MIVIILMIVTVIKLNIIIVVIILRVIQQIRIAGAESRGHSTWRR